MYLVIDWCRGNIEAELSTILKKQKKERKKTRTLTDAVFLNNNPHYRILKMENRVFRLSKESSSSTIALYDPIFFLLSIEVIFSSIAFTERINRPGN